MNTKNLTNEQKLEYAQKLWEEHQLKFKQPAKNLVLKAHKEKVGTALKQRINGLIKIKTKEGCGCNNLANEMDKGGIEWCNKNRDYIINHLVKNKEMLIDALSNSDSKLQNVIGWTVGVMPDSVLRVGAARLLDDAIANCRTVNTKVFKGPRVLKGGGKTCPKKPVAIKPKANPKAVVSKVRKKNPFFYDGSKPRFLKTVDLMRDAQILASKLPPSTSRIVGVARSGLCAATMVAMLLHRPLSIVRQSMGDVVDGGNGWRLTGNTSSDGPVVIIDDTVMTGNSFKHITPIVKKKFPNVLTAAVYVNPNAKIKPDIWAKDLAWPHILEWNVFNSILSPAMAVDFDGILCHDCPRGSDDDGPKYLEFIRGATPLYLPRKVPIPLIVTARIERYRKDTEDWLRRHDIKWYNLTMHPAKTLGERMKDNIPAYKARHYKLWADKYKVRPGPMIFMESEDWQAREIAKLSGKLCVCPHSGGVYGHY